VELSENLFAVGWQTGGGAQIDFARATMPLVPNSYNLVYFEYTGSINTLRIWVNSYESPVVVQYANGIGTAVNGFGDAEIFTYASQAGGGNYFKGMGKKMQFHTVLLSLEERVKAFNAGSTEGLVADVNYILDIDLSVTPPVARAGTPAFGAATSFGGITTPTYLP
jgi:hypothetical protein